MSETRPVRRTAAAALRGLIDGVGQDVSDRVRDELAAARLEEDAHPAQRIAAAALGGVVGGMGQNVADLLRQELGTARTDVVRSVRAAARGGAMLAGAAAAANTAGIFVGVAAWRGLGNRIGFAKSALVVAAVAGAASTALATTGVAELARVQASGRRRPTRTSAADLPM